MSDLHYPETITTQVSWRQHIENLDDPDDVTEGIGPGVIAISELRPAADGGHTRDVTEHATVVVTPALREAMRR